MRKRLWAAFVLFLLLSLSTSIYAGFVAYRTYEIESDNDTTLLIGMVTDSKNDPLEDVEVTIDDKIEFTDGQGKFLIEEVRSGIVTLHFYKPGYIPLELSYLAYPYKEINDDPEGSPNNISNEQDLVLMYEMETIYPFGELENGTVDVLIHPVEQSAIVGQVLLYGNGSVDLQETLIMDARQVIYIEGDGTLEFGFKGSRDTFIWNHTPGVSVNITGKIESFFTTGIVYTAAGGSLDLSIDDTGYSGDMNLTVVDPLLGRRYQDMILDGSGYHQVELELNPGKTVIILTGKGIRDQEFRDIVIEDSNVTELNIVLVKADPEVLLEGMDMSLNYILAVVYGAISILFILGAYLIRNGKRWTVPFVIALLGFLVKGFPFLPFNINLLLASIIIILIFVSREDYAIREKKQIRSPT